MLVFKKTICALLTLLSFLSMANMQTLGEHRQTIRAFQRSVYTDDATGLSVDYDLFVPKGPDDSEKYPLAVFFADTGVVGRCARSLPVQSAADGIFWASESEQAKHPCFVLAPRFPKAAVNQDDGSINADYLRLTAKLIREIRTLHNTDPARIYGAGQGTGAAAMAALSAADPDLMAALLLVGGHGNIAKLSGLKTQTFFSLAAEDDAESAAGQTEIKQMLADAGISYGESTGFDASEDAQALRETVETIVAAGSDQNFLTFAAGCAAPPVFPSGADALLLTLSASRGAEAVKDWLFAQTRIHYTYNEAVTKECEPYALRIESSYGGVYPQGKIVFYGSSSIRKWTTMQSDLAPLEVLNHGFGGSTLDDAIRFADRLVFPFAPKAVVVYTGANDLGNDDPQLRKTAKQAYYATVELLRLLRSELPDTKLYYISVSPNECKWKYWSAMQDCNHLVKAYCEAHEGLTFIDTTEALLDENGMYRRELFTEDRLHFNQKGYEVWTSVIRPILLNDFLEQRDANDPSKS